MIRAGAPAWCVPRPFLDALLLRVLLVWAFLRGAVGAGAAALTPEGGGLSPVTAVALLGVVVLAVRVEMTRQSELVFLANLGHSFPSVAALVPAQCLVLEALLRFVLA